MQSLLDRYISTFDRSDIITPAVISHDDALFLVNTWAKKDIKTIEKLKKEYTQGLYIYEVPEEKSEFPIEQVKRFIADTAKIPYEGKNLYLLLDIDTASHTAMNALLKVLEDTPEKAIILLVVSDRETLLETIHSRTIDLYRYPVRALDMTHRDTLRDFFSGDVVHWVTTLFSMKPTREEAIDILIVSLEFAPAGTLSRIENALLQLFTTHANPKNILDTVFFGE